MRRSTKRLIGATISLLFLASAFVIFFNFTQPAYQNILTAKGEASAREAFVNSKKTAINEVNKLIRSYQDDQELRDAKAAVDIALPVDSDLAGAIIQLNGLLTLNDLSLQSMNVNEPSSQQRSAANRAGGTSSFIKPLEKLAITLSISGEYSNFKNFLKNLENNIRIFDVEEINLNIGSNPQLPYNFSIRVIAYYQGQS